jgi:MFS family permease
MRASLARAPDAADPHRYPAAAMHDAGAATRAASRSPLRRPGRLRRDLRFISGDGTSHAVMIGLGETYLPAFALALGHGEAAAGLLATAPLLAGALLQLVTPRGVHALGSYRRWLVLCAGVQAASFLPLLGCAWLGEAPLLLLFAISGVYWACGFSAGSAWNAWVAELVPPALRAHYFARRARFTQIALVVSLAFGGAVLHAAEKGSAVCRGFLVLFALAGLARVVSAGYLARQSEVPLADKRHSLDVEAGALVRLAHGRSGRLFAYLVPLQLAVHVAAPYFTPFMLERLELSYAQFVALTGAAFLSRVVAMPALGRAVRRRGPRRILIAAGLALAALPGLWLVSDDFAYLLALQLLAGAAWGAHELAVMLLLFDALDPKLRLPVLSAYQFANASAVVGGALLGGMILTSYPSGPAYAWIFLVSTLARLAVLPLALRVTRRPVALESVPQRMLAVRPSMGAIQPPVVGGLPAQPRSAGGCE